MNGELPPHPTDDPDEEPEGPLPPAWSSRAQVIAAVAWPSFLAAAFATMLFFAFVDPSLLHDASVPDVESTRMTDYGLTFFFFWAVAAISSAVSVYLIRTSHLPPGDGDDRR